MTSNRCISLAVLVLLISIFVFRPCGAQDSEPSIDLVAELDSNGNIIINWYPINSEQDFTIQVKNVKSGELVEFSVTNATTYTATGFSADAIYDIKVYSESEISPVERVAKEIEFKEEDKIKEQNLLLSLDMEIAQLDLTQFPKNVLTAVVTDQDDGSYIGGLNSIEYWTVSEDGADITDCFEVRSGGFAIVDVVFLIDYSGSMGGEINAVRENVRNFVDDLVINGWDFRLGFVRFGSFYDYNQYPNIFNGGNLTDDVDQFKSWLNDIGVGGDRKSVV